MNSVKQLLKHPIIVKTLSVLTVMTSILLSSCMSAPVKPVTPEPIVVKQVQYVVKLPPAELLTLPPQVPNIDVDHATQKDVAEWLLSSEQRTRTLENMLKGIAGFFTDQQTQLDAKAASENAAVKADAIKATAELPAAAAAKPIVLDAKPAQVQDPIVFDPAAAGKVIPLGPLTTDPVPAQQ